MKFLVLTTPKHELPEDEAHLDLYREAREYIESYMQSGMLDCLYQRLTGGGVLIAKADTAEQLWEALTSYPMYAYFDWHIEPLVDIFYAFERLLQRQESWEKIPA